MSQEVIDFVNSRPDIRDGYREGNILYEVKTPSMSQEYLEAKGETMKRYYELPRKTHLL
jgi:hypothetical protein